MSDHDSTWHFVFPYSLGASGSGLLIQNLAHGLVNEGYQVHLVSVELRPYVTSNPACSWNGMILGEDFPLPRIPIYTRTAAPSIPFSELTEYGYKCYREALLRHWQRVLRPAPDDIVVVSHLWTHAAILKEIGIPVHGIMAHGTALLAFEMDSHYHEEIAVAAHWTKSIIANSSYVEQRLKAFGFLDPSIVVRIPPMLDRDVFFYEPHEYGLKKLVLHVPGKFVPFKGTDRLVRAVPYYENRNPDIHTVICGTGKLYDDLKMALNQTRADRLKWQEGWLSRENIAELLRTADVLVVPSCNEPFGMIAVEALSCGTPVVGDNSGGLRDIIGPGDGELTTADDPRELAKAILRTIENSRNPEHAHIRSARAANRFGMPVVVKQWLEWKERIQRSTNGE